MERTLASRLPVGSTSPRGGRDAAGGVPSIERLQGSAPPLLLLGWREGDRYILYRVDEADSVTPTIVAIRNPIRAFAFGDLVVRLDSLAAAPAPRQRHPEEGQGDKCLGQAVHGHVVCLVRHRSSDRGGEEPDPLPRVRRTPHAPARAPLR